MTEQLSITRDGQLVADLNFGLRKILLSYSPNFQAHRESGRPGVSCSLPVSVTPHDATAWCRGLLPEGQHLAHLAADINVSVSNTYALLRRYGRDVAGAYEIVAWPDRKSRPQASELYSTDSLRDEVAAVADGSRPLAIDDDSELSLAGLQSKLLLVKTANGWARPQFGYPSTHIAKLDSPTRIGLVDAEASALGLAKALELTTVDAEVQLLGDHRCIVVSRYDRRTTNGVTSRIHQEDFLQAMGLKPDGRQKYQDGKTGPPSLWHMAEILRKYAGESELIRLLACVTFNTLIGNGDAHAKNYSILIDELGGVKLAPLYDTVPTLLWPSLKDRNALMVGDQMVLSKTRLADVMLEGQRWGLDRDTAATIGLTIANRMRGLVKDVQHAELKNLVLRNVERFLPQ